MARVRVRLHGSPRGRIGKSEVQMDIDCIGEIFDVLDREYGTDIKKRIVTDLKGNNVSDLQVVVNGKLEPNLSTKIKPGDDIEIIPLVGGGHGSSM